MKKQQEEVFYKSGKYHHQNTLLPANNTASVFKTEKTAKVSSKTQVKKLMK